jgi:hypothetical protein
MRKMTVFVVLLALLALSFPVHAQEAGNDYPPCTEEEINTAVQVLEDYEAVVAETTADYDVAGDPNDMNYVLTLVAYDKVSSDYWNTIVPSLPKCIEAQTMVYLDASHYDFTLMAGLLYNAAAWTTEESPDDSASLTDSAANRLAHFTPELARVDTAAFLSGTGFDDTCFPNEISVLANYLKFSLDSLSVVFELIENYPTRAFVQTEGLSSFYDTEVFGRYFSCTENYWLAWKTSALLTDANLIVGLFANAAYEEAGGNPEAAATLRESAIARQEMLMTSIEELSAEVAALGG